MYICRILRAICFTTQVDVKFVRKLKRLVPLKELQSYPQLSEMALIKRGRLSVQPVTEEEYNFILSQEDKNVDAK